MSTIRANTITDSGGLAAPSLPNGVVTPSVTSTGALTLTSPSSLSLVTNGSERFRIDSLGRVLNTAQPAFMAVGNSSFYNTVGVLPLSVTSINRGNHFNTSTYTFTAPVAGVYLLTCQLLCSASSAGQIFYRHNGTNKCRAAHFGGSATNEYNYSGGSVLFQLAANDTVSLYMDQVFTSGNGVYLGESSNPYSWFTGYLLG